MAKTDFLTADMTRRQFMKISGKSLAGLTLSASMLSLFGCSQKQVDSGAVATWALPQGLLVVNADLCTGCQRCEINCTLTNDGVCSSYISRVKRQLLCLLPGYLPPVRGPRLRQRLPPEGHYDQRAGHPRGGHRQVHRLRRLPRGLPLAYAHRQPRDRQVVQVHRLRCLRGRLPVRRSVHRGLGCRHQRSTGCLHGPVRRRNNNG